jgi:hypothetical protein
VGEKGKMYTVLVGRPEGRKPLGRLRSRWNDGIKMDFTEIGWMDMDWIHLAQDKYYLWALVRMVMNLQVITQHS